MTPKCVRLARRRLRTGGFRGHAGRELARVTDAHRNHHIRIVEYSFPIHDGIDDRSLRATIPFVEAWETHDAQKRVRIRALSEVVHLIQNVGDDEFWRIVGRRKPKR